MRNLAYGIALLVLLVMPASRMQAQELAKGAIAFPRDATALEGLPQIRIDATREQVTRRELDATEAAANRLKIRIADGQFYWSSRDNRQLAQTISGSFVYLSSAEPGRYVRIRRMNDRFTYVEHVDTEFGSVTYWGELWIAIGH